MGDALPRIWIITDPARPGGPIAAVKQALEGRPGPRLGVQLRAKRVDDRQLLSWGRELRALTRERGCAFTVNGRADLAEILEADGVHLPETGLPIDEIRRRCPGAGMIGASRHDRDGLDAARRLGASYAFLSPVFDVPGKSAPLGIAGFAQAAHAVDLPVFALGGVRVAEISSLLEAGAHGVAVRRLVYEAANPAEVVQALLGALDKYGPNAE